MKINDLDYKILKFINSYDEISMSDILKKFPEEKYSTAHRIQLLLECEYETISTFKVRINGTGYIIQNHEKIYDETTHITTYRDLDSYSLTNKGKKAIQDLDAAEKTKIIEKRKEAIWRVLPILISAIALLKSFSAEINSSWKLLVQLLK